MVWGKGGLDEGGDPKNVTGDETELSALLLEKEIDGYDFVNEAETSCCYHATIQEEELVGEAISEVGLVDSEGDLVRYKTMPAFINRMMWHYSMISPKFLRRNKKWQNCEINGEFTDQNPQMGP